MSEAWLDIQHRKLDAIEKKLNRLDQNPAPTVPQYADLTAPAGSFVQPTIIGVDTGGYGVNGVFMNSVTWTLPVTTTFDFQVPATWLNQLRSGLPSTGYVIDVSNWANNIDGIRIENRTWSSGAAELGSTFRIVTVDSDNGRVPPPGGSGWNDFPLLTGDTWYHVDYTMSDGHFNVAINGTTICDYQPWWWSSTGDLVATGDWDWGLGSNPVDPSGNLAYYRNITINGGGISFGPSSNVNDFDSHGGANNVPSP